MTSVFDWLSSAFAAIGGVLVWFFGPWDALIMVLVAFVVTDYITGLVNAALHHTLSSEIGFKGLWKKVLIFFIVGIGSLLDTVIPMTNGALRATLCLFYIANEALSILENAGAVGLPLPEKLRTMLEQIKRKSQGKIHTDEDPEEIPDESADEDPSGDRTEDQNGGQSEDLDAK
ncbi:MAG: phage holin family protein [Bacillota bacterium]